MGWLSRSLWSKAMTSESAFHASERLARDFEKLEKAGFETSYIGHTYHGSPIPAFLKGTGKKVALVGGIHGNEALGIDGAIESAMALDSAGGYDILLVPCLNLDGAITNWRTNSNGNDINRRFGKRKSPESVALMQAIEKHGSEVIIDYHMLDLDYWEGEAGNLVVRLGNLVVTDSYEKGNIIKSVGRLEGRHELATERQYAVFKELAVKMCGFSHSHEYVAPGVLYKTRDLNALDDWADKTGRIGICVEITGNYDIDEPFDSGFYKDVTLAVLGADKKTKEYRPVTRLQPIHATLS